MALSSLPLDVADSICHFLDTPDLLSLSLTNTLFCPFAQRLIFRHVAIHSPAQAVRCLTTLSKERDLALFVRSFSLRLDSSQPVFRPFIHMLAVALSHMSNVTSLDLVLHHSMSTVLAGVDTGDVAYPRLVRFACNFSLDANVSAFLQRAPQLSELQLSDGGAPSAMCPIHPTAIPHLTVFIGSCEAAYALVPGRPLESVHIHSGDLSDEILSALSQSTASISIFGALTRSLSPSLLISLASNLPHLRHLRIMTMYHSSHRHHDQVSDATELSLNNSWLSIFLGRQIFYAQVAQILGTLPELLTAELAGIHWASWKKQTTGVRSGWRDKPLNTRDNAAALDDTLDISDDFSSY